MRLSVRMVRACHGHALIDIKLFHSVNVFKYTPLGVSGPKNIFPQTGSELQKSENGCFRFRNDFQNRLLGTNYISDQFCTQKDPKQNEKCTKNAENT